MLSGLSASIPGPIISILLIATKPSRETPQLKFIHVQSPQDETEPPQYHLKLKLFEYLFVLHWLRSVKTGILCNRFLRLGTLVQSLSKALTLCLELKSCSSLPPLVCSYSHPAGLGNLAPVLWRQPRLAPSWRVCLACEKHVPLPRFLCKCSSFQGHLFVSLGPLALGMGQPLCPQTLDDVCQSPWVVLLKFLEFISSKSLPGINLPFLIKGGQ